MKILPIKPIAVSVEEALTYIDGRREGTITSLKTGLSKLDKNLLDGVEWNKIFSIAGMSGSGKSTIVEMLKRNFCYHNDTPFKILSFEFEMSAAEQVSRNISGRMQKSTKWLFSGEEEKLKDDDIEEIRRIAGQLKDFPIYSVERVGSVDEIIATIKHFAKIHELKAKNEGLVVTIDHVLLTKGKQGEGEKEIIDDLFHQIMELKKVFIEIGIKVIFIMLSQLNRNIEQVERRSNVSLHYPAQSDLFGASSIFQCSDYVLVSHKPANLELQSYGPPREGFPKGLPIKNPKNPAQCMIYWHLIKHRSGEPKIMMMVDNLKNSAIDEY